MTQPAQRIAPWLPLSLVGGLAVLTLGASGAAATEAPVAWLRAEVPHHQVWTSKRTVGKKRHRKKISIDLQGAEIKNVIRLIADVSGLNIVVGDDVKGTVTMKLKSVPWDQALEVILKAKGLGLRWEGDNLIRVAPQAVLDEEDRREADLADSCVKSGALKTKIIPVNYARAADLVPIVKNTVTERGRVTFDERTNVLIVKDVACSPAFR